MDDDDDDPLVDVVSVLFYIHKTTSNTLGILILLTNHSKFSHTHV